MIPIKIDLGKVRDQYSVVNAVSDGLAPKFGTVSATKYLRADGTWQVPPDTTYTTNSLKMTGYSRGSNITGVIPSDSVNQAIGKLENRLDTQFDQFTGELNYFPMSLSNVNEMVGGSDTNWYVKEPGGLVHYSFSFRSLDHNEHVIFRFPVGYRSRKTFFIQLTQLDGRVGYGYIIASGELTTCGNTGERIIGSGCFQTR